MKIGALIINSGCNNYCVFCAGHNTPTPQELIQQEKIIFENIKFFLANKYDMIEISGADPASYKELYGLIAYLKQRFKKVRLLTHGKNLNVDLLSKAGLDEIKIPIYGPNAKIHEKITRSTGSFDKSIETIKNLSNSNIKLIITSLIFKQNLNFLEMIYELALKYTPNFTLGMPFIIDLESSRKFYIPYNSLIGKINKLIQHTQYQIKLIDIPYCIIGFNYKYAFFSNPPELGIQQPPSEIRTHLRNIPSYRVKIKLPFCRQCILNQKCAGFLKNDIKFYGINKRDYRNGYINQY